MKTIGWTKKQEIENAEKWVRSGKSYYQHIWIPKKIITQIRLQTLREAVKLLDKIELQNETTYEDLIIFFRLICIFSYEKFKKGDLKK